MSGGVTAVLQSMLRNTEEREDRFARALRDQVARVSEIDAEPTGDGIEPDGLDGLVDGGDEADLSPAEPKADAGTRQSVGSSAAVPSLGPATAFIDLAGPGVVESPPQVPARLQVPEQSMAPGPAQIRALEPEPAPARFAPALKLPEQRTDVAFGEFGGHGRPMWSRDRLADIGMPREVLDAVASLGHDLDLKWVEVVVRAASGPCAAIPDESAMIVSTSHTRLADVLGLPIHRPGDLPPYGGSIFCLIPPQPAPGDIQWLRRVQGDRGMHVVLDDETSQNLIGDDVTTVSYSSELGAALALKWALAKGLHLGFGVTHGGEPIRATPFDVALAIRSWMRSE